jgi:hypothetical protein
MVVHKVKPSQLACAATPKAHGFDLSRVPGRFSEIVGMNPTDEKPASPKMGPSRRVSQRFGKS